MTNFVIDYDGWSDSGGCCQVYAIKNCSNLVFKEFRTKNKAISSYKIQKSLSHHDLAPKILSKINRFNFDTDYKDEDICQSDWGYVTEKAFVTDKVDLHKLQSLVNEIYNKTGLTFWDSHYYNVGFVKRNGRSKLVCIDSGKESFIRDSNAWGFATAGPQCSYCLSYQCRCGE